MRQIILLVIFLSTAFSSKAIHGWKHSAYGIELGYVYNIQPYHIGKLGFFHDKFSCGCLGCTNYKKIGGTYFFSNEYHALAFSYTQAFFSSRSRGWMLQPVFGFDAGAYYFNRKLGFLTNTRVGTYIPSNSHNFSLKLFYEYSLPLYSNIPTNGHAFSISLNLYINSIKAWFRKGDNED